MGWVKGSDRNLMMMMFIGANEWRFFFKTMNFQLAQGWGHGQDSRMGRIRGGREGEEVGGSYRDRRSASKLTMCRKVVL
jgi:hypothetical protein